MLRLSPVRGSPGATRDLTPKPATVIASIANFLRGSDREFFDLFERAGTNIEQAARLLDEMLEEYPERRGVARDILACEQDGDQITHEIIRRLNQTFVTPIDREDILQLASALDDIVDYTEEVADYLGLYRIEAPMVQAQRLAGVLRAATAQIAQAIPLVRGFKDISEQTVEVHRLENEADRIVREAIASLFEVGIDPMVVIRWKDIYERLENAIDSTERAAYILEGIVIKNA
jgi:predicted phosphate transport protein (TIGR00153 family)